MNIYVWDCEWQEPNQTVDCYRIIEPDIEAAAKAHWLARGYDLAGWDRMSDDIKPSYLQSMKTAIDAALIPTDE